VKRFGLAFWLVVVWIFLWGDISLANILGGAAVAVALLVAFPGDRPEPGERNVLRPLRFVALLWFLAKQLVRSNVLLAREVVTRGTRLRTAVIAAPLHTRSPALVNATCNLMALNPGTLVIEIDEPGGVVFIHVFYLHEVATVARDVDELQRLVIDAFTPSSRGPIARTNVRN
jgi:multicomponent Na+:H+ antiporter subunit E